MSDRGEGLTLEIVAGLACDSGRALLAGVSAYGEAREQSAARGDGNAQDPLRASEAMRRAYPTVSPALLSAALTQVRMRRKARSRLGPLVDRLLLTADGSEQATRTLVAARRAQVYLASGATHIADLGCGIGADALAFAAAGMQVTAVEMDEVTAAVARANAEALGMSDLVEVITENVTDPTLLAHVMDRCDAAYVDPARRSGTNGPGARRVLDPRQWSPPWPWVVQLAADMAITSPAVTGLAVTGAKVAPGIDHWLIPPDGSGTWTSVDGSLVEAFVAWPGMAVASGRHAVVLRGDRTTQVSQTDLPSVMPTPWAALEVVGHRLLDPDDAVVRAGLVGVVTLRTGGALLDPAVAYVAAPAGSDAGDLVTAYDVEAVIPFHSGRLRELLRARGVGRVTITKRAFAGDVEQIRTQLKLDRKLPGTAVVIITRIGSDPWAFVCQPDNVAVKSAS